MTAPQTDSWSGENPTAANLDKTTHGVGTTAERTAITSWPADRPFLDTTLNRWFYNSHGSAPSSITWSNISTPKKRRILIGFTVGVSAAVTKYSTPFAGDISFSGGTRTSIELPISDEALTLVNLRGRSQGNTTSTSFTCKLMEESVAQSTLTFTAADQKKENTAIGAAIAAGANISLEISNGSATVAEAVVLAEFEYDAVF